MHVAAAIFDLDGVLADTTQAHYLSWLRLAEEEGIYFDKQINEYLKGVSRMAALEICLSGLSEGIQRWRKLPWQPEKIITIGKL